MRLFIITLTFLLILSKASYAYLGLAPLIPIIGQGLLYLVVMLVFVFGLFLYPIKLLFKKRKAQKKLKKTNKLLNEFFDITEIFT